MEILQGAINRDDYFSVKEAAEILGVTTKTIRNRIEKKQLPAVWYEIGKGQSQWLIKKDDIKAIVDKDISESRQISVPHLAIIEEIKAVLKVDNDALRAENDALRAEIKSIRESQARIERMLLERDERLMQAVEIKMKQEIKANKPWYKFW